MIGMFGKVRVFLMGVVTGCILTGLIVAGAPYLRAKAIETLKGLLAEDGVKPSPSSTPYPAPKTIRN